MLFSFDLEEAIVTLISLDVETERFPFTVNVVSAVVPDIFAELSQVTVPALFVAWNMKSLFDWENALSAAIKNADATRTALADLKISFIKYPCVLLKTAIAELDPKSPFMDFGTSPE